MFGWFKKKMPKLITAENSLPDGLTMKDVVAIRPVVRVYYEGDVQRWHVEDANTGKRLFFEGVEVSQWQLVGTVDCPCLALGFKQVSILE